MVKRCPLVGEPEIRSGGSTGKIGSYGMTRNAGTKMHKGVDYLCWPGLDVQAAHDGVIERMFVEQHPNGTPKGWGACIEIRSTDGTTLTRYAHLEGFDETLQPGSRVAAGRRIGWSGRSGYDHNPRIPTHLHWEVWVEGHPIDPVAWLESGGEGDRT